MMEIESYNHEEKAIGEFRREVRAGRGPLRSHVAAAVGHSLQRAFKRNRTKRASPQVRI
jgi:hypothetical protein